MKVTTGLGKTLQIWTPLKQQRDNPVLTPVGLFVTVKLLNHISYVVFSSLADFYSSKRVRQLWTQIFTVMLCT